MGDFGGAIVACAMVVKEVDREDEQEIIAARKRADIIVRKRAAETIRREEVVEAAEKASRLKGEGSQGQDLNAPLWKIWAYLRPTWGTAFGSEFEVVGMIAIALTKIVELRLQTQVARALLLLTTHTFLLLPAVYPPLLLAGGPRPRSHPLQPQCYGLQGRDDQGHPGRMRWICPADPLQLPAGKANVEVAQEANAAISQ